MIPLVQGIAAHLINAPLYLVRTIAFSTILLTSCVATDSGMFENLCVEGSCNHPLDMLNSMKLSRVNYVQQLDQMGCGAAAISSVLGYWDKPIKYETIVSHYPSNSEEGYTVGELKTIAAKHGMIAFSLQMTEQILKENLSKGRPIIIAVKRYSFDLMSYLPDFVPLKKYITYSHYFVVFGYGQGGYWIMDPAEGYKYISATELREMWQRQHNIGILVSSKT